MSAPLPDTYLESVVEVIRQGRYMRDSFVVVPYEQAAHLRETLAQDTSFTVTSQSVLGLAGTYSAVDAEDINAVGGTFTVTFVVDPVPWRDAAVFMARDLLAVDRALADHGDVLVPFAANHLIRLAGMSLADALADAFGGREHYQEPGRGSVSFELLGVDAVDSRGRLVGRSGRPVWTVEVAEGLYGESPDCADPFTVLPSRCLLQDAATPLPVLTGPGVLRGGAPEILSFRLANLLCARLDEALTGDSGWLPVSGEFGTLLSVPARPAEETLARFILDGADIDLDSLCVSDGARELMVSALSDPQRVSAARLLETGAVAPYGILESTRPARRSARRSAGSAARSIAG